MTHIIVMTDDQYEKWDVNAAVFYHRQTKIEPKKAMGNIIESSITIPEDIIGYDEKLREANKLLTRLEQLVAIYDLENDESTHITLNRIRDLLYPVVSALDEVYGKKLE